MSDTPKKTAGFFCPGSPTTIFYRLVSEPPFFIVRFIIFQKEPPFLKWWLTSRVCVFFHVAGPEPSSEGLLGDEIHDAQVAVNP